VVALADLQTRKSLGKNAAGGQAVLNFQQAYAQLVSDVGNKTRQTQVMATAQQNLVAQTKQAQQSIAGVNLDDEAANLLRYQQAYQASGKMMQIATSLFQTLLDISR
jgi:flagellar hook-associated protein 1 FlgK